MNTNAQDKWFELIPNPDQKQQFKDTLLTILAENGMGDGETESIYETVPLVIERLQDLQPQWKSATGRQLSTASKRWKSHYDQVRAAYTKRDDTESAIADLKHAKEREAQAAKEKKLSTPSTKADAGAASDGSYHSGKSTKKTKQNTRSATKGTKATPDISKLVEDIALDWIRIHIKEVADKSLRKENADLKKQIVLLRQTNRYMRKKISNIKAECEFASGELDHAFGDGTLYPRISETPDVNEHRGSIMPMQQ